MKFPRLAVNHRRCRFDNLTGVYHGNSAENFYAAPNYAASVPTAQLRLRHGDTTFTNWQLFDGANGAAPSATPSDSSGNLYGITREAAPTTAATVFEAGPGASVITCLALFSGNIEFCRRSFG